MAAATKDYKGAGTGALSSMKAADLMQKISNPQPTQDAQDAQDTQDAPKVEQQKASDEIYRYPGAGGVIRYRDSSGNFQSEILADGTIRITTETPPELAARVREDFSVLNCIRISAALPVEWETKTLTDGPVART